MTRVVCGAVAFAVPAAMFYRLVMYHFYVRGSFLLDTGLLASLTWHNTALVLPPSLGGESFFAFHMAPILMLVSAVSELLPATLPQMFAGFVGLSHGLLAVAMFWVLAAGQRGWIVVLAAVAGIGFAFGGLAIAIARYPHFEMFGAACLLLSLVALARRQRAVATVAFICALSTREDVGLHAFAFLSLWAVADRLRGVPWRNNAWVIGFALAGLAWSGSALLVQHAMFPGHSSFARIYMGDPPYAHLTAALLADRFLGWLSLHACILLPAIAVAFWAARTRDPFLLLGYVACIPWALLHLFAVGPLAGWMVGYYGYPFLIAMAWPLLAGPMRRREMPGPPWVPAAALLGLVALSLLPVGRDYDPGRIALPDAFLHAPSAATQAATDGAVATLAAARGVLGPLRVDNSIVALAPFAFAHDEIAGWGGPDPHTALFFVDGFDAAALRGLPGLPGRYAVAGTPIRIATDLPEQAVRALGLPLVQPE